MLSFLACYHVRLSFPWPSILSPACSAAPVLFRATSALSSLQQQAQQQHGDGRSDVTLTGRGGRQRAAEAMMRSPTLLRFPSTRGHS